MTAPGAPAAGGASGAATEAELDAALAEAGSGWGMHLDAATKRWLMRQALDAAAAARAPSPAEVGRAGLEPPGCPIPGACACPGGESRLAERLAAELRRREAAEADAAQARGVLRRVEWAGPQTDDAPCCPSCFNFKWAGHMPGCPLAAALVDHAPTSAGPASADDGMQSAATPTSDGDGHGR